MSKFLNRYAIPFVSLAEGKHQFDYDIDDKFFENYELSEIKHASLKADIELERRTNMLTLQFSIKGSIRTECDVCLDLIDVALDTISTLYIKFGDDYNEESDDVLIIPRQSNEINVAQYIYEFTHLALPVKRVHPLDENDEPTCNSEMLSKLNSLKSDNSDNSPWDVLKNLNTN